MYSFNSKRYVWQTPGSARHLANSTPTVKHGGGSIMLFSAAGIGKPFRIEWRMNEAKYKEVLEENLLQSAHNLRLGRRVNLSAQHWPEAYSQDNAGSADKSLTVLVWPSQSPDLNPIEHLWKDLMMAVHRCFSSNLERFCQEEELPKSRCANLVET